MKIQSFLFVCCFFTFSIDSFPQVSWPDMIRVNYSTANNIPIDNIVIRFSTNPAVTTAENIAWDARSLNCCSFIASIKSNINFAVQTRPLAFDRDTVKLRVASTSIGNFKLDMSEFLNFSHAKEIFLLDEYNGVAQNVKLNSSYIFAITSDPATQGANRFRLVFVAADITVAAPEAIEVNNAAGTNGAYVPFDIPVLAKCSTYNLSYSIQPGSFFPIGNTAVMVNAVDVCGNQANSAFNVIVKDTEVPQIGVMNAQTFSTTTGSNCYSFIPVPPAATDNSNTVTVTGTRSDWRALNGQYPIGTTIITWKAVDASGNTATSAQIITVKDLEPPVINVQPVSLNTEAGSCTANILTPLATATDNSRTVSLNGVRSDGRILSAPFSKGVTNITWTANDASGNSVSIVQFVTVTDNELPVIVPTANNVIWPNTNDCKFNITNTSFDPLVTDNCPGIMVKNSLNNTNTLSGVQLPKGSTAVVWTATDAAGNTTTWQQVIEVNAPSININIPDTMAVLKGAEWNTIYIGYAPASVLSYTVTGNQNVLGYSWTASPGLNIIGPSNTAVLEVTALTPGNNPSYITLVAKGAYGCSTTMTKQVKIVDISCGNRNEKILVCSPALPKSLCINPASIGGYLLNGYKLGDCLNIAGRISNERALQSPESVFSVYPNPNNGAFELKFGPDQNGPVEIKIIDLSGRIIVSKKLSLTSNIQKISFDLQKHANGMYHIQIISMAGIETRKLIIAR